MAKYTSQIKAKTGETTNVFISQRERRRGYRMYRWYFTHYLPAYSYGDGAEPISVRNAALWHRLDEPALTERDWLVKAFASSNTGDASSAFDGGEGWFSAFDTLQFDYDNELEQTTVDPLELARVIQAEHYLGVMFDRRVIVNHYDLAPVEFSGEPTSWVFQASNDGNGWTGLHIVTDFDWENVTYHEDGQFVRFDIEHVQRMI